jgi:macrolide transport system ATP-binding/permease protein
MSYEILKLNGLHKTYGAKLVLDNIHLNLNRGERAALVGENGTGKTTLARILTGEETADGGTMRFAPGAITGYLPQEVTAAPHISVQQYIEQALGALDALRRELEGLEHQMTAPQSEKEMAALLENYGTLQAEFDKRGGYTLAARLKEIFAGLSIEYLDTQRPLYSLSGGEKTRVALAALLLREPDLLILDEPTNHLDFAGIAWLETYLLNYPHALLMVTHDRHFINQVATHIIELSPVTHGLKVYFGNYEDFLAQRDAEYEKALGEYLDQRIEIKRLKRQAKQLVHNPRATPAMPDNDKMLFDAKKANSEQTRSKKIRDAKQRIAVLEETMPDNPAHHWTIRFEFAPLELHAQEPLRFSGLSKTYGDACLFSHISGVVPKGERIVLVAPNGTGKSTLLKLLIGQLTPDSGSVTIAGSAKIGYLDQEGETLNPAQNVLAAYREVAQGEDRDLLAELHRSGLFTDASLPYKTVGELSLGQKRKLALARLIASKANVLLLDEPTNHLDLLSLEALEEALRHFPGAILAVSHDRWFVEHVATQVWELHEGALVVPA